MDTAGAASAVAGAVHFKIAGINWPDADAVPSAIPTTAVGLPPVVAVTNTPFAPTERLAPAVIAPPA